MFHLSRSLSIPGVACALLAPATALAQTELWITQFGTTRYDGTTALAADSAGGVFAGGFTHGSLGAPSAGLRDAWVARFTEDGALDWMRQFGTPSADRTRSLAPDMSGGTFVAGDTIHGSLGGPSAGSNDVWLARYNEDGTRLWITQFGSSAYDTVESAAPDGSGGILLAGWTDGSLGRPGDGSRDAWIARHEPNGVQRWIVQLGTSVSDRATAVTQDGASGAFVGGYTRGDLGGISAGSDDAWVARYDSNGEQIWVMQFGTPGSDILRALAPDGSGGFFASGMTRVSLGPPWEEAWVGRFDADGNQLWMDQFGTPGWDEAVALAPDGRGGVFVAGETQGSLFAPSTGSSDAWIAHYDEDGNRLWSTQFGSGGLDLVNTLAADGAGGIFTGGISTGQLGGQHFGDGDAWIARFGDDSCYADCDGDGALTFFDFLCFQNLFAAMDPASDCDGDGALTFFDFLCFQNAFLAGCP